MQDKGRGERFCHRAAGLTLFDSINKESVMKQVAVAVFAVLLAGSVQAEGLPWGKEMATSDDLSRPYGLGVDFFPWTRTTKFRRCNSAECHRLRRN
jgi:hypothetical protein